MRLERRRRRATRRPPAKLPLRQSLVREPKALAVVTQNAQRGLSPTAEDEQPPAERIGVEHLPADAREAVDALAKILRLHRDQDAHLRRDLNHDAAPASCRTNAARSESASPWTRSRTVVPAPSISITDVSVATGGSSTNLTAVRARPS